MTIDGDEDDEISRALRESMSERTAAVFMASKGRRPRIPIELAVSIARPRGVPVIVDAAYEIPPKENLWYFTRELGADLAIFSGGKGLRGPASTGLIVGRQDLIDACRFNRSYASKPAVAAKIGKEEIVGLYAAVKELVNRDEGELTETYRRRMGLVESVLRGISGVQLERVEHGPWADQFGINIAIDPEETGMGDGELYAACASNDPPIEVGPRGCGVFLSVSTLRNDDEARLVAHCIRDALMRKSSGTR